MKKEIKNKINKLKEEGKTKTEISKELNLPYSTICYNFNEDYKLKQIKRTNKYSKENRDCRDKEKYKEYQRNYHRDRYNNDPEFREKVKERNRLIWRRKNK